jgi:hypothetical protein
MLSHFEFLICALDSKSLVSESSSNPPLQTSDVTVGQVDLIGWDAFEIKDVLEQVTLVILIELPVGSVLAVLLDI